MPTRAPEDLSPATGRSGGSHVERVTVNLNTRASEALEQVANLTGETKTDAINRALQVYALLHQLQDDGGAFYTRERGAKELERLRIL
jgi:hypothetical protein